MRVPGVSGVVDVQVLTAFVMRCQRSALVMARPDPLLVLPLGPLYPELPS